LHTVSITTFQIDNISIFLLLLILLSPFVSVIRKVKFGNFEAEIDTKEVKKLSEKYKYFREETQDIPDYSTQLNKNINYIFDLVKEDPVIALAKLRIELEKILTKIYRLTQSDDSQKEYIQLGKILTTFKHQELISKNTLNSLREVISICNRAIHGEEISEDNAAEIIEIGTSLLSDLYWSSKMELIQPIEKSEIDQAELECYRNAKYEVITIVPVVGEPFKNIRILTQEGLYELLDGYEEYAEFVVSIRMI